MSSKSRTCVSVGGFRGEEDLVEGSHDEAEVEPDRPVVDVFDIEADAFADLIDIVDLPTESPALR